MFALPPQKIKSLLASAGARALKSLGQNFLIDERVFRRILAVAEPLSGAIIEVGPGLGQLTRGLAENPACRRAGGPQIFAVEKDRQLALLAKQRLSSFKNVSVIQGDILKLDLGFLGNRPYDIVANLPYGITAPFFKKFLLKSAVRPQNLTLLVQEEAAQKMNARQGQLNFWAALAQNQAQIALFDEVPASAFWPRPKVRSRIIKLSGVKEPVNLDRELAIFAIVSKIFGAKRKTMRAIAKRLAPGFEIKNFDTSRRPQDLSVSELVGWANEIVKWLNC